MATHHNRPFAGILRNIPDSAWPQVAKINAHRSQEQAETEGDLDHWHGNEAADNYAKNAAMHNLPAQVLQTAQTGAVKHGKKLFVALASLFNLWPKYKEAVKAGTWAQPEKPQKRVAQERRKHEWVWSVERNLFRCSKCHITAFCTRRLLECIPVPSPPHWETP